MNAADDGSLKGSNTLVDHDESNFSIAVLFIAPFQGAEQLTVCT
ncbi:MAG: hypothetical protein ABI791_12705 [Acidobacteriota bacterium]